MTPVEKMYRDGTLRELAENMNVANADLDDLVQEVALILLEYEQEKIEAMAQSGQLKFFITRVMMNQYFSKTSTYHYRYRRWLDLIDRNKTIDNDRDDTAED